MCSSDLTEYTVQVAALTRKGDGLRSKKVSVKTPGGVPSRPDLKLKIHSSEAGITMELEWTRPLQTFGEVRGYRLKYGPKNTPLEEILIEGSQISSQKIQKLGKDVLLSYGTSMVEI